MNGERASLERWVAQAHPLFWVLLAPVLPALAAACSVDGGSPTYALESEWVYRLEVALAFYFGLLLVCLTLRLAYFGHTFRRVELPGGPAIEMPDLAGLAAAARGFSQFRHDTEEALAHHEEAIGVLDHRLAALEDGRKSELRSRMRRVLSRT